MNEIKIGFLRALGFFLFNIFIGIIIFLIIYITLFVNNASFDDLFNNKEDNYTFESR